MVMNDMMSLMKNQLFIMARRTFIVSKMALSSYNFLLIASFLLIFLYLSSYSSCLAFYYTVLILFDIDSIFYLFFSFMSWVNSFFILLVSMKSIVLFVFDI